SPPWDGGEGRGEEARFCSGFPSSVLPLVPRALRLTPLAADSTHRDQRNALVLVVAGDSLCPRVQGQLPIHEKRVAMMPVLEFHPQKPRPIRLLFHRMRCRVPLIEIA